MSNLVQPTGWQVPVGITQGLLLTLLSVIWCNLILVSRPATYMRWWDKKDHSALLCFRDLWYCEMRWSDSFVKQVNNYCLPGLFWEAALLHLSIHAGLDLHIFACNVKVKVPFSIKPLKFGLDSLTCIQGWLVDHVGSKLVRVCQNDKPARW